MVFIFRTNPVTTQAPVATQALVTTTQATGAAVTTQGSMVSTSRFFTVKVIKNHGSQTRLISV